MVFLNQERKAALAAIVAGSAFYSAINQYGPWQLSGNAPVYAATPFYENPIELAQSQQKLAEIVKNPVNNLTAIADKMHYQSGADSINLTMMAYDSRVNHNLEALTKKEDVENKILRKVTIFKTQEELDKFLSEDRWDRIELILYENTLFGKYNPSALIVRDLKTNSGFIIYDSCDSFGNRYPDGRFDFNLNYAQWKPRLFYKAADEILKFGATKPNKKAIPKSMPKITRDYLQEIPNRRDELALPKHNNLSAARSHAGHLPRSRI